MYAPLAGVVRPLAADELDRMERVAGLGAYIQASLTPVGFDDLPRLYCLSAAV